MVARGDEQHHEVAGLEGTVADSEVLGDGPAGELDRRHVAQQLLDAGAGHLGSSRRSASWSGCSNRANVPPAMRLTVVSWPGHQQEDAGRQQLGLGEHVALVLRPHEPAQQIVTRVGPPLGQELEEVLGELHDGNPP